jgi:hypothetical protein
MQWSIKRNVPRDNAEERRPAEVLKIYRRPVRIEVRNAMARNIAFGRERSAAATASKK